MFIVDWEKVENLKAQKGISTRQLSNLSGLCGLTLCGMMYGLPCKPLNIHKLAKALGVGATKILKERKEKQ